MRGIISKPNDYFRKNLRKKALRAGALLFLLISSGIFQRAVAQVVTEEGGSFAAGQLSRESRQTFNSIVTVANFFLGTLLLAALITWGVALFWFIASSGNERVLHNSHKAFLVGAAIFLVALIGFVIISIVKHFFV
jgi:hypothetical protein